MDIRINRLMNRWAAPAMWCAGAAAAAGLISGSFGFPGAQAALFILGALLAGLPILWRAIQGLRFRTVGIEALVSIAVIGAFCIGELSEAAIVTFLFQFGSWLEQKTMKKTRSAIRALTELAPSTALRMKNGEPEEIDADEVEEGDLLLVRTGGRIAVDGTVVSGEGYVNEASITGESEPRRKQPGDTLYAGTLLDSGTLQMIATRVGEDTTFARIIALVEEAQDAKSPAERFIDKFAKYYTPAVVVLAALVLLAARNADTAITVLVLACPGALVIGAPIANVAGIGRGAREGILLKGGDSVHTFAKTDTVLFDKTGTLTVGHPCVVREYRYTPDSDAVLALAASAERASDHPLAMAVQTCAGEKGLTIPELPETEIIKGRGIRARTEAGVLLIGSPRLMAENGISLTCAEADLRSEQERGATCVLTAVGGELKLMLAVTDAVRKDASQCIRELRSMGVKNIVMLTGDHASSAGAVAAELGITDVRSELLPEEKLDYLRRLRETGCTVTFVGDGVNDSPALTAADTGIAMGGGTEAAIESSEVVLIRSELANIPRALKLARATVRTLRQNIAIAVGTVVFLLIGLFAGWIHMSVGMLVHEASILAVILNAMRFLIRRI